MACQRHRLEADFAALGKFGSLETGGFTRVAFSLEDLAARDWLQQAMSAAGLDVRVDAVGNIRGRRDGSEDLAPVMLGSHLDTVPEGGNYDGSVGVLAGLEIVRILNDLNLVTKRPIEVVNFSAEESSRFGLATIGSKAMTGKIDLAVLQRLTDKEGFSLYETLQASGYFPDDIQQTVLSTEDIHAFLELHIEQGPVLEQKNCPIGIVTTIAAPTRFKVTIEGQADHSGNTPMPLRKDALAAAAEVVLEVERTAKRVSRDTVATVGYLYVAPGAMNVIPGRVELGIDIRDISMENKDKATAAILDQLDLIAVRRGVAIRREQLCDDLPVRLSGKVISTLVDAAETADIDFVRMPSGAGHDAMNMAAITDVGMIFIPSVGGISHNIEEYSRMEDICVGTDLLFDATLLLAQE